MSEAPNAQRGIAAIVAAVAVGWLGVVLAGGHLGFRAAPLAALCVLGPAYVLSILCFPRTQNGPTRGVLVGFERVGLTILFAFALIIFTALALVRAAGGLDGVGVAMGVAAVGMAVAGPAAWRRLRDRAPQDSPERFPPGAIAALLAGVILVALTTAAVFPGLYEPPVFTELLLLPESGDLSDLALTLRAGDAPSYRIEIATHQRADTNHTLSWRIEKGEELTSRENFAPIQVVAAESREIFLAAEDRAGFLISSPPLEEGLYRLTVEVERNGTEPETRVVHAWIDVRA